MRSHMFKVCLFDIPGPMSPRDSSPLEDICGDRENTTSSASDRITILHVLHCDSSTHLSCGRGSLPMSLPFIGCGLRLRTDVSFTALQTQFIGQILGQVAHLSVLRSHMKRSTYCLPR